MWESTNRSKKKIPMRKCVGCGQLYPKETMLRIVRILPDGFVIDRTHKQNGRGAYLCRNQECITKVLKKRGLGRSFKGSVSKEIYQQLAKEMSESDAE